MNYMKFLAIVILCTNIVCSKTFNSVPPDINKIEYILPINHYSKSQLISLVVEPPSGFRPLHKIENYSNGELIEFIPETENEKEWSSIFTILPLTGKFVQSKQFTNMTLEGIQAQAKNVEVLETKDDHNSNYTQSSMGISYNASRPEVLYMVVFSGPADSVVIQYTSILKSGENAKTILEDIKQRTLKLIKVIDGSQLPQNDDR